MEAFKVDILNVTKKLLIMGGGGEVVMFFSVCLFSGGSNQ